MTAHADPTDSRITCLGEWRWVAGLNTVEDVVEKPSLRMGPPFSRQLQPVMPHEVLVEHQVLYPLCEFRCGSWDLGKSGCMPVAERH